MTQVRKLRHWKQRFDKNAKFIWRRAVKYGGKRVEIGSAVPEDMAPTKLKRFWEANIIELAEFEAPNVATGQRVEPAEPVGSELPEGVTVKPGKGSWFQVHVAGEDVVHRVNGKRALAKFLDELAPENTKQSPDPENVKQPPRPEDAPGEIASDDDEHDEVDAATVDGATTEDEKSTGDWLD